MYVYVYFVVRRLKNTNTLHVVKHYGHFSEPKVGENDQEKPHSHTADQQAAIMKKMQINPTNKKTSNVKQPALSCSAR